MKLFRISNVLILVAATALGGALFWTSQRVQEKQAALSDLTTQSHHEQESLSVLGAEWDYLNRPQRLEQLARDYLDVARPGEQHIVTDVAAVPEPALPIIPPGKPQIIPAMVKAAPVEQPKPAPVIEKNDSARFDSLLKSLSGGGE